jgi:glutathione S-transferase
MKLFFAPASPFVRKVLVCAIELGVDSRIERLACAAHPVKRDPDVVARNPLGKIPTLITDEGDVLFDSRVICEYLDGAADHPKLFPASGPARFRCLRDQALGDGVLDAAILIRYEEATHEAGCRSAGWIDGQLDKIEQSLRFLDAGVPALAERLDVGTIAVGCALGYLDLRFAHLEWRARFTALARWFDHFETRPSMQATRPRLPGT